MMYITTIAARIRNSSLLSEASNAEAEPWNAVMMLAGIPSWASVSRIALTALPSEPVDGMLNEIVLAGNWLRWLMSSGSARSSMWAMADSGTWPPPADG